jgi:G3E family GTPase
MKVIQIAGFLGSGKTTVLLSIAKSMGKDYGKKVAIIVNEIGSVPVDAKVLEQYGLKVSELGGGCICCELLVGLADTLIRIREAVNPDIVLIEPTGVAIPDQIKDGINMGASRSNFEAGPAVVLFDALIEDELINGDPMENFIVRQMANADIIAVNKIDAVDEDRIQFCEKRSREINANARIIRLSALRGDGMDTLVSLLVGEGAAA